ncbi:MAG: hypothetical protein HQL51_01630 [Magnetococcales bacterium]|nr:hypothetical protein [Magnetococcales bacterium]
MNLSSGLQFPLSVDVAGLAASLGQAKAAMVGEMRNMSEAARREMGRVAQAMTGVKGLETLTSQGEEARQNLARLRGESERLGNAWRQSQDELARLVGSLDRMKSRLAELKKIPQSQITPEQTAELARLQAEYARLAPQLAALRDQTRTLAGDHQRAGAAARGASRAVTENAAAIEALRTQLRLAGVDTTRMKATGEQLKLARNAASELAVNLGNPLLPVIAGAAKLFAGFTRGVAGLVEQFPTLATVASVSLTTLLAFRPAVFIFSALKLGVVGLLSNLAMVGRFTAFGALLAALNPLAALLTVAGGAAMGFALSAKTTSKDLRENADALGQNREETAKKIKALEELKVTLESTTPGTREHLAAEEKLAAILPEANLELDKQGRVLARVGGAWSDNAAKVKAYLDLLKRQDRTDLVVQMESQARAAIQAEKELADYREELKRLYGLGAEGEYFANPVANALAKWTGSYDRMIGRGPEMRRNNAELQEGLERLAQSALDSGMSVKQLAGELDKITPDPEAKKKILDLFTQTVEAAVKASAAARGLSKEQAQVFAAIKGPADAARKVVVDAIGVVDKQLAKTNEALGQHREKLKQAVDDESKSWKAMGEAAAEASKTKIAALEESSSRALNDFERAADGGVIAERRRVAFTTNLLIQETAARLAESRRYQGEALALAGREYQTRMAHARRLGIDATRVDEERVQAQRRILEQTETAYRSSIDKLIGEERRHLDAANQLAQQRANFMLSVEDRLARIAEKGKSPAQVEKMRQERLAVAQSRAEAALRAGDYESVQTHTNKMMELAEQSDNAARAYAQVEEAARIASQAFQAQEGDHRQAAEGIRGQYEQLSAELAKVRGEMETLSQSLAADHQVILSADISKVEEAARQIDALLEKKERVVRIKAELQTDAKLLEKIPEQLAKGMTEAVESGLTRARQGFESFKQAFKGFDPEIKATFDPIAATATLDGLTAKFSEFRATLATPAPVKVEAGEALNQLAQVQAALAAIPPEKSVTVRVRQVTEEAHRSGGLVGLSSLFPLARVAAFARGGRLPGFGGGDRIRALLEAGEFVIRKEAVRKYGANLFAALNAMRLNLGETPRFQHGGLVHNLVIPPVPAFAAGGAVGGWGVDRVVQVNLNFGEGQAPIPVFTRDGDDERLLKRLRFLDRGR